MLIKHPTAMLVVNTKDIYDSEPAIIISDNITAVLSTRSGKLSSNKEDGTLLFLGINVSINYQYIPNDDKHVLVDEISNSYEIIILPRH
jgi:hypothetical protein